MTEDSRSEDQRWQLACSATGCPWLYPCPVHPQALTQEMRKLARLAGKKINVEGDA